jgi:DNA-directed RNA polymerase subunit M/transcription elongation factor TFIIS
MLKIILQIFKNTFEISTYKIVASSEVLIDHLSGPLNALPEEFLANYKKINSHLALTKLEKAEGGVKAIFYDLGGAAEGELTHSSSEVKSLILEQNLTQNTYKKFVLPWFFVCPYCGKRTKVIYIAHIFKKDVANGRFVYCADCLKKVQSLVDLKEVV